jgi:hypothetical protein
MIIISKRMAGCQSGFHDQELQKKLVTVPVQSGPNVVLCDFCLSRMIGAQEQGGDLTMAILCQWNPNEKVRFIQMLEEDENTIHNVLDGVLSDNERGNIALRLWTGCLCAAKECRRTCIAEHRPDGTTRRESPYTSHARAESFKKILITSNEDPIYEAGVQAAPVWELIENAAPDKKMYLEGISNVFDSPVAKYLKDRNKTIISADDIEINK